MEKKKKITISIVVVVAVVIAAVVATLALVNTKPLADLASYEKATIYTGGSMNSGYTMTKSVNKENDTKLREELKNCSYSLFQQMVSGDVDNFNIIDGEGEEKVYTITELGPDGRGLYTDYNSDLAMVVLSFGEKVTYQIGREEYTFDTVQFLVPNTEGQVREITCVAYVDADFNEVNEETAEKEYGVFRFYANTTSLYDFIQNDILA